jgi:glycosyltransferase involved in cell wall biosynthesis
MQRNVERLRVPASRIVQIPNWADGQAIKPIARNQNALRAEWGLGDDFVVAHSGNLGRAHDAQAFLAAIEHLERGRVATDGAVTPPPRSGSQHAAPPGDSGPTVASSIRWLFIGGGAQFGALEQAVVDKGLRSVVFMPYQPRERLAESLSSADVHLVTLRPELEGLIVPSKVYGCLAVGRPIVFVGAKNGEIGRLVRENHCGCVVAPDDTDGLARAVLTLAGAPDLVAEMGHNARRAFDRNFDLGHAQRRWRALIHDLQAQPQGAKGPAGPPPHGPTGSAPRVNLGAP